MNTEKIHLAALAILFSFALVGCNKPNSAEQAGRDIDRAAEKAGEKMDRAAEKASEQTAKAGQVVEDATITTKIKTAIAAEPGLKVLEIKVDTVGGVVTLTGSIDSQASSDRAQQVASGVSGVKQVENRLTVKAPS